jgi:hypothetical protein
MNPTLRICASALIILALSGCSERDTGNTVTEEVEAVMYRTRLFHPGCASNGCWCVSGQPRKITAYGIDKYVWPHRCDGCGSTNEIYDAQWPKFRREWRAVK